MHIELSMTAAGLEKRIQAIKDVRAATGLGLKEAKDLVDRASGAGEYNYPQPAFLYENDLDTTANRTLVSTYGQLSGSRYVQVRLANVDPVTLSAPAPPNPVAYDGALLAVILLATEEDLPINFIEDAASRASYLHQMTQAPEFAAAHDLLNDAVERLQGSSAPMFNRGPFA